MRSASNDHCAGVPGLEPRTKESESSVLPITPHPTVSTEAEPTVYFTASVGEAKTQHRQANAT